MAEDNEGIQREGGFGQVGDARGEVADATATGRGDTVEGGNGGSERGADSAGTVDFVGSQVGDAYSSDAGSVNAGGSAADGDLTHEVSVDGVNDAAGKDEAAVGVGGVGDGGAAAYDSPVSVAVPSSTAFPAVPVYPGPSGEMGYATEVVGGGVQGLSNASPVSPWGGAVQGNDDQGTDARGVATQGAAPQNAVSQASVAQGAVPQGAVQGDGARTGAAAGNWTQRHTPYGAVWVDNAPGAGNPYGGTSGSVTPVVGSGASSTGQAPAGSGSYGPQGTNGFSGNRALPSSGVPTGPGRMAGAPMPPVASGPAAAATVGRQAGSSPKRALLVNVLVAIVAAVVSAGLCLGLGWAAISNGWVSGPGQEGSLQGITSNQSGPGSAKAESGQAVDWTAVAKKVSASVVSIQSRLSNGTSAGSGAIVDTEGHVVTNNHVISGAKEIQVMLSNGQIWSAQVIGADATTDLAVLKIDNPPEGLQPVEFADSDKLAVGEAVMAIGNPLGYDDTATTGIVSALNRPVSVMDDNDSEIVTNAVQIDAAINPGNSGGPTFNGAGQVIGTNSSIASTGSEETAGSIGIGFAIPANLVKRVSQEIIKDGAVKHVSLGVRIQDSTVEADGVSRSGAQVVSVVDGSAAQKAGLKVGDTIVAFNGVSVTNNYSVLGFVRAAALGDVAKLTVVRSGSVKEISVTLDQQEGESGSSSNGQSEEDGRDDDGKGGFKDPFGLW